MSSGKPFILPCCGCFVVVYINLVNMLPMPNLLWEADGTLTDEASHELLLLHGCADAALEVAFVKHGLCLWSDIVCKCVYR